MLPYLHIDIQVTTKNALTMMMKTMTATMIVKKKIAVSEVVNISSKLNAFSKTYKRNKL